MTRNYVWLREDMQDFVKSKLTHRFKGAKDKEGKKQLNEQELYGETLKNRYATRKNNVMALVDTIFSTFLTLLSLI